MHQDMYVSNLSSRKMRNQLKRHFDHKISHVSILDWVRRYVIKVQKFINKLKPTLGKKVYADETEIDRQRNNDIFWCAVDWETRFIEATLYSPLNQNMDDAKEFMRKIRENRVPEFIQTDGLPQYPTAFKKVFYTNRQNGAKHIANNVRRTGKHNVRIETVLSKIKDRIYDFRGLKALWSAPILLAGIVLQHNFIEAHTTTGQIPAELAKIKLDLGENRWLGLIRMASVYCSI